ncbi:hypothetical protein BLNAU_595 [Blattamonas nauphoetae]|uniref:Uncharacterized protein n=1 Tax=Blattamonas nauphoetae TaxID=2049346 RepID=A0ABQ9YLP0_9EUKA|nr:hypothetical protein BLNAU_595 [Blattamonas nauphoetae]
MDVSNQEITPSVTPQKLRKRKMKPFSTVTVVVLDESDSDTPGEASILKTEEMPAESFIQTTSVRSLRTRKRGASLKQKDKGKLIDQDLNMEIEREIKRFNDILTGAEPLSDPSEGISSTQKLDYLCKRFDHLRVRLVERMNQREKSTAERFFGVPEPWMIDLIKDSESLPEQQLSTEMILLNETIDAYEERDKIREMKERSFKEKQIALEKQRKRHRYKRRHLLAQETLKRQKDIAALFTRPSKKGRKASTGHHVKENGDEPPSRHSRKSAAVQDNRRVFDVYDDWSDWYVDPAIQKKAEVSSDDDESDSEHRVTKKKVTRRTTLKKSQYPGLPPWINQINLQPHVSFNSGVFDPLFGEKDPMDVLGSRENDRQTIDVTGESDVEVIGDMLSDEERGKRITEKQMILKKEMRKKIGEELMSLIENEIVSSEDDEVKQEEPVRRGGDNLPQLRIWRGETGKEGKTIAEIVDKTGKLHSDFQKELRRLEQKKSAFTQQVKTEEAKEKRILEHLREEMKLGAKSKQDLEAFKQHRVKRERETYAHFQQLSKELGTAEIDVYGEFAQTIQRETMKLINFDTIQSELFIPHLTQTELEENKRLRAKNVPSTSHHIHQGHDKVAPFSADEGVNEIVSSIVSEVRARRQRIAETYIIKEEACDTFTPQTVPTTISSDELPSTSEEEESDSKLSASLSSLTPLSETPSEREARLERQSHRNDRNKHNSRLRRLSQRFSKRSTDDIYLDFFKYARTKVGKLMKQTKQQNGLERPIFIQ